MFTNWKENRQARQELIIETEIQVRAKCEHDWRQERGRLIQQYEDRINRLVITNTERINSLEDEKIEAIHHLEQQFVKEKKQALELQEEGIKEKMAKLNKEINRLKTKVNVIIENHQERMAEKELIINEKNKQIQSAQEGFQLYRQHVIETYDQTIQLRSFINGLFNDTFGPVLGRVEKFVEFFDKKLLFLDKNTNKIEQKLQIGVKGNVITSFEVSKEEIVED